MSNTATSSAAGAASNGNGNGKGAALVLASGQGGVALIPQPTDLTRLNYFDGKFLRADDLRLEQDYLRSLVWLSNRAGGSGVVSGLDVRDAGAGALELSAGLAIDPRGRVLSLPWAAKVDVAELIAASAPSSSSGSSSASGSAGLPGFMACDDTAAPPATNGTALPSTDLYVILAQHAEARCGDADVYGKLCEDACITSTDRPYRLEGIVVLARPLSLPAAPCTAGWLTGKHRRSQAASAFFADERARMGADMSGTRLKQELWCAGATAETGDAVPLAVVSVTGGAVQWVDEWIARRERLADPALRFWQWQTGMRPLAVFWAQVLQFQCQLADDVVSVDTGTGTVDDPCSAQTALLKKAQALLADLEKRLSVAKDMTWQQSAGSSGELLKMSGDELFQRDYTDELKGLHESVTSLLGQQSSAPTQVLIDRGIVDLPPAGYLPVTPGGAVDVNTQVRRLMGDGVDLRFCVVRPDYVGHAFEEGQHLERICLLEGLNDAAKKPQVDIFVPDGVVGTPPPPPGASFEVTVAVGAAADLSTVNLSEAVPAPETLASFAQREFLDTSGDQASADTEAATANTTADGESIEVPRINYAVRNRFVEQSGSNGELTFRGAGRTEPLATGGGAFHVAGRVTGTVVDFGKFSRKLWLSSLFTGRGIDVFAALGAAFRGQTTGKVYGNQTQTGTQTGTQTTTQTGEVSIEPRDTSVDAGLWATMAADRDPFALRPGDETAVRLELNAAFVDQDDEPQASTLSVTGFLRCDQGGDATGSFKGRLRQAWATASSTNDEDEKPPVPLKWAVELEQVSVAGGMGVTAKVELVPGLVVTLQTTWGGTPLLALGHAEANLLEWIQRMMVDAAGVPATEAHSIALALAERTPGLDAVRFAAARLRQNDDVLRAENKYHALAVKALKQLEASLPEPGFRQAGELKLFPSAPAPTVPSVSATRDWVLFRRRRASTCDCCPPAAVQADRRYAVYLAPDRSPDNTIDTIRDVIAGKIPIPPESEKFVQRLGVVPVFRGGSPEMASSSTEVAKAWNDAGPPTGPLIYAAIMGAGAGSADADAILSGRLDRLVDAIPSGTQTGQAVLEPVPEMADLFDDAGADGVIVLVTRAAETQHRVLAAFSAARMSALADALTQQQGSNELPNDADDLGYVVFDGATPDPETLAAVKAAAQGSNLMTPSRFFVVSRGDDVVPAHEAQCKQIITALGLTGTVLKLAAPLAGNEDVFGDAEAVTIAASRDKQTVLK